MQDLRIRAWVIRVPAFYIGLEEINATGFQTVIQALNEEEAVKLAQFTQDWEVLDFEVKAFQVFPKFPTVMKL